MQTALHLIAIFFQICFLFICFFQSINTGTIELADGVLLIFFTIIVEAYAIKEKIDKLKQN